VERRLNGGVFLWGIGNSIAAGISELVRTTGGAEVLFSPIKSGPRPIDVAPDRYIAWTKGEAADGSTYPLPANSIVISGHAEAASRHSRYALICHSESQLVFEDVGHKVEFAGLRNLISGKPVGASQVTAVVVSDPTAEAGGTEYPVAFRAALEYPYFIRLRDPVPVILGMKQATLSGELPVADREARRDELLATRAT
jgi:hypothetical protein